MRFMKFNATPFEVRDHLLLKLKCALKIFFRESAFGLFINMDCVHRTNCSKIVKKKNIHITFLQYAFCYNAGPTNCCISFIFSACLGAAAGLSGNHLVFPRIKIKASLKVVSCLLKSSG